MKDATAQILADLLGPATATTPSTGASDKGTDPQATGHGKHERGAFDEMQEMGDGMQEMGDTAAAQIPTDAGKPSTRGLGQIIEEVDVAVSHSVPSKGTWAQQGTIRTRIHAPSNTDEWFQDDAKGSNDVEQRVSDARLAEHVDSVTSHDDARLAEHVDSVTLHDGIAAFPQADVAVDENQGDSTAQDDHDIAGDSSDDDLLDDLIAGYAGTFRQARVSTLNAMQPKSSNNQSNDESNHQSQQPTFVPKMRPASRRSLYDFQKLFRETKAKAEAAIRKKRPFTSRNKIEMKTVHISCTVFELFAVDTQKMTFTVEVLVRGRWLDPLLKKNHKIEYCTDEKINQGKVVCNAWSPRLNFRNTCADTEVQEWYRPADGTDGSKYFKYKDENECWACVDVRFRGEMTTQFNLGKLAMCIASIIGCLYYTTVCSNRTHGVACTRFARCMNCTAWPAARVYFASTLCTYACAPTFTRACVNALRASSCQIQAQ